MGLDVFLHKCPNREVEKEKENKYRENDEKLWNFSEEEYKKLTQQEKDSLLAEGKKFALSLGLNEDGTSPLVTTIDLLSKIDPKHYFKIGYFRSSYNGSGINRVLKDIGIPDLYEIFPEQEGGYEFEPYWEESLERVNKAISLFESFLASPAAQFNVVSLRNFGYSEVTTPKQAVEVFMKQVESHKDASDDFCSYSCREGEFFLKGEKVFAIIPSKEERYGSKDIFIICEANNCYVWYLTALKIVKETIEYVIAQPDRKDYYLCWSA